MLSVHLKIEEQATRLGSDPSFKETLQAHERVSL